MQSARLFESGLKLLRRENAAGKGKEREEIADAAAEITREKLGRHQDNVAGLRIRKDMIADDVGIGVLKAAAECEKGGEQHGVGDLTPGGSRVVLHEKSFLLRVRQNRWFFKHSKFSSAVQGSDGAFRRRHAKKCTIPRFCAENPRKALTIRALTSISLSKCLWIA